MDFMDHMLGLFSDFSNPKKRVFFGYLALSVLIAFAWLLLVRRASLRSALSRMFDPRIWFSGSAWADYKIFVINR
ncbi:MAG: sterol desaturase family protein, partial [Pseudomonadota bacterium]